MADSSGEVSASTSPVLAAGEVTVPAAGPVSTGPVVPAPDVRAFSATPDASTPEEVVVLLPASSPAEPAPETAPVPSTSVPPVSPTPVPAPAVPETSVAVRAKPTIAAAPPKSFRDAIRGAGSGVPVQQKTFPDYSSPEMQEKYLPLIQGTTILTSPETDRDIVPRTIDIITREVQSRRVVSLSEDLFGAAVKRLNLPIQMFAKVGFGRWNVLLPSVAEAKEMAARTFKYTAADGRTFLLHPEYLGCRKTKITVLGVPATVPPNVLGVCFSQFGRVESVIRETGTVGLEIGRCILQVYLPVEKIAQVPSKFSHLGMELVVMVEGRQPTCWRCGRTGHLAKLCPLGRPATQAAQKVVEKSAAVSSPKTAPATIPGLDPGWQVKESRKKAKKAVETVRPAPIPVIPVTPAEISDDPVPEPMDSTKSRKRAREEAGNAAASKSAEKSPSTSKVVPSPCGSDDQAPIKSPPSPTKKEPKKKRKKIRDPVPAPETSVSSKETAHTPKTIDVTPEVSSSIPPETPVLSTPESTQTPPPPPNPDPTPDPPPAPDPPSAPDPVVETKSGSSTAPPSAPDELFSFSDYLESEDESGSSSAQEQGDCDQQIPRYKKPFPFQTGKNICKVDRRLRYEWTELSKDGLKPLLDYTKVGKGDSAKDVENPLLFPDAPFMITTVRVSKMSGGRKPDVWTMLDAAEDAFSDLKLFEREDTFLNSQAARCRDRVPIYVHPSFYRALKLTYPYDVGGLVRDGRFTKEHSRGIMSRSVGVLSAADFQGF